MIKNSYTFAPRLEAVASFHIDYSFEFTIIYLPGLYLYSTLGRFFHFKRLTYGV
ncbi:hypothetical protein AP058_00055 [Flavobacterium sp. TAB 87]|nr:hypothetical protein AP058_00055 [Flavobacterium sp. TAB 87]